MSTWLNNQKKVPGNYNQKDINVSFTEDFIGVKALNAPVAVGKYQAINLETYKQRSPRWDVKSSNVPDGYLMRPIKKDASPSPVTYKV